MKITVKLKTITTLAMLTTLISACGSNVGIGPHPSLRQTEVSPERMPDTRLATLPPREMAKGECAVFLWSEESSRPLVFVQNIATNQSTMLIDHQQVDFDRSQASDMIIPGFFARQNFSTDKMQLSVRLRPEDGRNLYEGIKIPSGIITVTNDDQSENIVAVSGLLGCNLQS